MMGESYTSSDEKGGCGGVLKKRERDRRRRAKDEEEEESKNPSTLCVLTPFPLGFFMASKWQWRRDGDGDAANFEATSFFPPLLSELLFRMAE